MSIRFRSLLVACIAGGCAVDRPHVDPEASIEGALAIEQAVRFREDGSPVDAVPGAGPHLSAADALARAISASPDLQAALARVRVAQAEADQAAQLPNPILSVVLRFPADGGSPEVEAGLGAEILAILQRPGHAEAAGHRLRAEAARALSTALDVVAEVQERYASVQALSALVPRIEERRRLLERLRAVAQARLDLGEGTRHDVRALDAERIALDVELSETEQELRLERLALARAIGEPSGDAAWALAAWEPPPPVTAPEEAWIDAALAGRPEILAIEWEIRAREAEERLARGQALGGASIGLEAERVGDWSLGPSVATPLPIFDTGRSRADRARALTFEERHRLTAAQRGVVEEVRRALATFDGTRANHERVVAELIPLQELRRAAVDEAFRAGLADATDLLFAEQALQSALARSVALARDVATARIRLQRAVGGPRADAATSSLTQEPLRR